VRFVRKLVANVGVAEIVYFKDAEDAETVDPVDLLRCGFSLPPIS
jgi:hypothetical protein